VTGKDKKKTVYYFDKDAHKKYHAGICKAGKPGKVTGKVSKEDDRNIITVSKLEYKKAKSE
jgi:hypothetical protein